MSGNTEEFFRQNGSNWLNKGLLVYKLELADSQKPEDAIKAPRAVRAAGA